MQQTYHLRYPRSVFGFYGISQNTGTAFRKYPLWLVPTLPCQNPALDAPASRAAGVAMLTCQRRSVGTNRRGHHQNQKNRIYLYFAQVMDTESLSCDSGSYEILKILTMD